MNVSAFRIANFKAFAATQRVPLRPITLIYGANSAGKSSALHTLALTHHAVETGDLDTQRTQIGGESIDLGGFRQYVHRHQREQQVQLGFELDPGRLYGRVAAMLRSARKIVVELSIGEGITSNQQSLFGDYARELDGKGVRLERFGLEVDDAPLFSMSARPGGLLRLDSLDHAHPVFRELFRGLLTLATTTEQIREEDFAALGDVLDVLIPSITAKRHGLFPRVEDEAESSIAEGEAWEALVPVSRGHRREDLARATQLFLPKALRDLVEGLGTAIEDDVRRLRYLGPLRSCPPRHLAFAQHHDPNWFAGGGYAWDVVRTRGDIRQRVNAWLGDGDRLKTPYELEVRDLLPATVVSRELPTKLGEALLEFASDLATDHAQELLRLVARYEEDADLDMAETNDQLYNMVWAVVDEGALSEQWTQEMVKASPDVLQDLVLIDKRTGTPVSHRDVGIGVSQVLPVLVSAFASENRLVAIEQPEIHLHPALQAELGDVFAESALEGGNTFLIETHSEHLLLRIMRRIRQTSSGDLPDGVPAVRPDDVMVLFVEPDGPRSIVREMPLNERGELVKAWPGGFFEEGLREIF